MRKWLFIVGLLFSVTLAKGEAKIGYTYDSRNFALFEIVTSTDLAKDIKFWGFTDIYNEQGTKSATEFSDYFMEYRLDFNILPIGKQHQQMNVFEYEMEYNGFNGVDNDLVRTGFSFTHKFFRGGFVRGRYHPWDTRGEEYSQASLTHFIPLVKGFSFFGFYDYHIEEGADNIWYYEPSLIYAVNDVYSLILIYRYNGFAHMTSGQQGNGIAVGIYRRL